jgi:hypothetical protein
MFFWDESAWLTQNDIGSSNWNEYAEHIQNHGNLGSIYPKNKWGVEGDTPSYLHVLPNGLHDPSVPEMTGWGGYFEWGLGMDKTTYSYTNHAGSPNHISEKYENYFYPAIFNNFAARMDWAANGEGNINPVVIVDGNGGLEIITRKVRAGEKIVLDSEGSYDPDGDEMTFRWWVMPESGTYVGDVQINGNASTVAEIAVPEDASGKTVHIICEVHDDGSPVLTSYRRVILKVD